MTAARTNRRAHGPQNQNRPHWTSPGSKARRDHGMEPHVWQTVHVHVPAYHWHILIAKRPTTGCIFSWSRTAGGDCCHPEYRVLRFGPDHQPVMVPYIQIQAILWQIRQSLLMRQDRYPFGWLARPVRVLIDPDGALYAPGLQLVCTTMPLATGKGAGSTSPGAGSFTTHNRQAPPVLNPMIT